MKIKNMFGKNNDGNFDFSQLFIEIKTSCCFISGNFQIRSIIDKGDWLIKRFDLFKEEKYRLDTKMERSRE
jgi:hypothetical protein